MLLDPPDFRLPQNLGGQVRLLELYASKRN